MNKNTLIGILIAVVVLGGGYLLLKKPAAAPVVTTSDTPAGTTDQPGTTPDTTNEVAGAPSAVTNANAGTSSSTAIVNGQIEPNGATTTYWFDYGTTAAFGTRSPELTIGSGYGTFPTPTYITGLKASTLYYFRLSAKNAYGVATGSTQTFSTNTNPPPQGTAPTVRTAAVTNLARTSATLSGQVNMNGFSGAYWFEYGTSANFGRATTLQTASVSTGLKNVSLPVSNLIPLTKYYYRINAQNQFGTNNGSTLSFTTPGPASVPAPTVTAPSAATTNAVSVQATTAQLSGRVDPNGGETLYWFEYSKDPLLATLVGTGTAQQKLVAGTNATNVHSDVSGLYGKTTYYYRIVAKNSAGVTLGTIVSFKTK